MHAPGQADLNVYAYVHGAVLKNTDPLGLCTDGVDCSKAPDSAPQGGAAPAAGSTPEGGLKSDREVIQGVVDKLISDSNRELAQRGCGANASCPQPDEFTAINNSSNMFNREWTEGAVIKEQQAIAEENRLMAYERGGVQSVPSPVDAIGIGAAGAAKALGRMTLEAPTLRLSFSGSPRLAHLTDAAGAEGISTSSVINGPVYASTLETASQTGLSYTLRTGVSAPTAGFEIPQGALTAFSRPIPVGPISAWQRFSGTYTTGAGSLDLAAGTFVRTGVNWNQAGMYAADGIIDAGAAFIGYSAITVSQGE